jgi:hypothetical protein
MFRCAAVGLGALNGATVKQTAQVRNSCFRYPVYGSVHTRADVRAILQATVIYAVRWHR